MKLSRLMPVLHVNSLRHYTTAISTVSFSYGAQRAVAMSTGYRAKGIVLFLAMFCTTF